MTQHDNPIENPVESLVSDEILGKVSVKAKELELAIISGSYLIGQDDESDEEESEKESPYEKVYAAMSGNTKINFLVRRKADNKFDHFNSKVKTFIAEFLGIDEKNINITDFEATERRIKENPQNANFYESMLFSRTRLRDMVNYGTNEKFNDISYQNLQRRLAKKIKTDSPEKPDLAKTGNSSDEDKKTSSPKTPSPNAISELPDSTSSGSMTPDKLPEGIENVDPKLIKFYEKVVGKLKQTTEVAQKTVEQERKRAEQAEKERDELKAKLAALEKPLNTPAPFDGQPITGPTQKHTPTH